MFAGSLHLCLSLCPAPPLRTQAYMPASIAPPPGTGPAGEVLSLKLLVCHCLVCFSYLIPLFALIDLFVLVVHSRLARGHPGPCAFGGKADANAMCCRTTISDKRHSRNGERDEEGIGSRKSARAPLFYFERGPRGPTDSKTVICRTVAELRSSLIGDPPTRRLFARAGLRQLPAGWRTGCRISRGIGARKGSACGQPNR